MSCEQMIFNLFFSKPLTSIFQCFHHLQADYYARKEKERKNKFQAVMTIGTV